MGQAQHDSRACLNSQTDLFGQAITTPQGNPAVHAPAINQVAKRAPTPGSDHARPFLPLRERLLRHAVTIAGKDGYPHLARPIAETDAGALIRCYDAMTDRGKWFRVLYHLPHLSEDMARAFCTPDPDCDLCIVLEGDGPLEGEILGGARITGDKDGRTAEYSVTLRPEAEGLGLAHKALELVFEAAREMAYIHIWGAIHSENGPMLQLAHSLHLNIHRDPNDAALMVSEGDL